MDYVVLFMSVYRHNGGERQIKDAITIVLPH
jgi:tRNA threonylcarbamoyladenosine modification (KEOPS) complex Cgi121 subunit